MVLPWSHIPVWLLLSLPPPNSVPLFPHSSLRDPSKVGSCCLSPARHLPGAFSFSEQNPHLHMTPSTHLLGHSASTALPASWASTSPGPFTRLPLESPVPALCTAPVASLGPGHSADHSPLLSLCPVFMEHSLCFGPVHSRMCAP